MSRLDQRLEILEQGFNSPLTCPTHSHGQIVFHGQCEGQQAENMNKQGILPFFALTFERSADGVRVDAVGKPAYLSIRLAVLNEPSTQ